MGKRERWTHKNIYAHKLKRKVSDKKKELGGGAFSFGCIESLFNMTFLAITPMRSCTLREIMRFYLSFSREYKKPDCMGV